MRFAGNAVIGNELGFPVKTLIAEVYFFELCIHFCILHADSRCKVEVLAYFLLQGEFTTPYIFCIGIDKGTEDGIGINRGIVELLVLLCGEGIAELGDLTICMAIVYYAEEATGIISLIVIELK